MEREAAFQAIEAEQDALEREQAQRAAADQDTPQGQQEVLAEKRRLGAATTVELRERLADPRVSDREKHLIRDVLEERRAEPREARREPSHTEL